MLGAGRAIPEHELVFRASRAGGAGGQHVNTSSTRVEVVWNVMASGVLSAEERARVSARLASRLDSEGNVRVVASDTRSQSQNRELAMGRLAALVRKALAVPRERKATKPSRASKERRLDEKKRAGQRKRERRGGWDD
jgi:ribosome-associated protein